MRLVLPFRLAPDTLAAPVSGPQHFLVNHPEKRKPVQVQRHRYKKQDVEGGVLSAALKLGNVNTRETSEISKFLLRYPGLPSDAPEHGSDSAFQSR